MKCKQLTFILCILLILSTFAACSQQPTIYADKDNSPVTINIWEGDDFMKHHINIYNSRFDEPQIEYNALSFEYLDNAYQTMESDIKEGKAPDLVLVDIMFRNWGIFENKLECFTDMDELIDRSVTFNFDKYNKDVMDSIIEEDKRWYIPFSYDIACLVSTKENLELYYTGMLDVIDYDKYLEAVELYQQEKQNSPATYGMPISKPLFLNDINEFKNIIPTEKLQKAIYAQNKEKSRFYLINFEEINSNFTKWFLTNDILFTLLRGNVFPAPDLKSNNSIFAEVYYTYNVAKSLDKELLVFKYPSIDQEKSPTAGVHMGLAISATSNRKNKAMRFIEYMLSADVQAGKSYSPRIPVNNEALDILAKEFSSNSYDILPEGIEPSPLPRELVVKVLSIIKDAKTPSVDNDIGDAYTECVQPHIEEYQDNFLTFEKFINLVNSNLDRYYSADDEEN